MASKGQTFNRYSTELKHKVLEEYIALAEEWIDFYNTERIRLKKK